MNLSHAYGVPPSPDDAERLLGHALDRGVTLLDTATLYGGGKNEELIGRAVMHRRDDFILASKCGLAMVAGKRVLNGRPESIATAIDASLRRLKTEYIDLYYLHRLDPDVPIEDSTGALVRGIEAGKIRTIGLSEMSSVTVARAHTVHPIAAVQNEYSPIVRNPEAGLLATCRARGIALVAYSPLARGLLAGSIRDASYASGDIRLNMPRFVGWRLQRNLSTVEKFKTLAAEVGATSAQLALAWVLWRGSDVIAIPGTTSLRHFNENIDSLSLTLDPATFAAVDHLFNNDRIEGARYSASAQAQIDTETLEGEELD